MNDLLQKLEAINYRFIEVGTLIVDPDIIVDMKRYVKLTKEYKDLEELVEVYKKYKGLIDNLESSKALLKEEVDAEMREMAKMEIDELEKSRPEMEEEIKTLLIPKDPEDEKCAIMELRAGTGGDEACIFVEDCFRMYTMFFKERGWSYEVVNTNEGTTKGFKEITINIDAPAAYGVLKFESGVHRVQRVPETESQGRVHTSAITIAVLPEAEEVDIDINPADIRRDTYRASGAGGQHVNKTESAIRLTHVPTGVVAECQDGRSQHKNLAQAMTMLRSRLFQIELDKIMNERSEHRKSLVSTGDRSAKIRTYNYPQGRITDHRINKTMYNLGAFMNGDLQEMIDSLKMAENAEKLKGEDE
ncbi:peptide chain release factor 1 [Crocinitomicaceae bacterium]|nr:peptide chain release factor 1 [Crocinitomicaceae bacterium]MDC0098755.1 peptide chain release factor 1 [Crocinitomicaceae bacterium]MDC1282569.1 peptide chain release factor 1 [Crocinitomicaceae bacterium]MDC1385179.1 peptide chain release factor 1 [Crocinitomicaceae bacterium]|tara:strand:- start:34715 stop:35794 length:1080 start_codon:yes stop_codon:yes gene_type:complete